MHTFERRRYERSRVEAAAELIWKDEPGERRFECGNLVDYSPSGAGLDCPQSIPPSSWVVLRALEVGVIALGQVRSCSWRRSVYRMGIEFFEKAPVESPGSEDLPIHQLLRAGISGDSEKVDRLYRSLAFRYHPDNGETGDAETFLRIRETHRIVSTSRNRTTESSITRPLAHFNWQDGIRGMKQKRFAVLGLLFQQRINDFRNPTVSQNDLVTLTGIPPEEIGFILWYLREKEAVTLTAGTSSDHAISAKGVDLLETLG